MNIEEMYPRMEWTIVTDLVLDEEDEPLELECFLNKYEAKAAVEMWQRLYPDAYIREEWVE